LRSLAVLLRAATILGSKGRRQGLFNMFTEEQRSELKAALTADYLGRERATELPPELEIGSIIARDRLIDTMFYEIMCYTTDEMQGSGVLADPQNQTVVITRVVESPGTPETMNLCVPREAWSVEGWPTQPHDWESQHPTLKYHSLPVISFGEVAPKYLAAGDGIPPFAEAYLAKEKARFAAIKQKRAALIKAKEESAGWSSGTGKESSKQGRRALG
jgi:hypothetical protein